MTSVHPTCFLGDLHVPEMHLILPVQFFSLVQAIMLRKVARPVVLLAKALSTYSC